MSKNYRVGMRVEANFHAGISPAGEQPGFYPATILDTKMSDGEPEYRVRWDDGFEAWLGVEHLR